MNTELDEDRLIVPIPKVQQLLGDLGLTKTYELIGAGELVQVHIGRRSFVTRKSIEEYVDRLQRACA